MTKCFEQCYDFRTFTTSIITLFRMILGDFNFKAIEQANTFLGPVYFLSYIFFVFFVLLVRLLACIINTLRLQMVPLASLVTLQIVASLTIVIGDVS
jgi:Polycystin cation channel